jgi:hypothetical protein
MKISLEYLEKTTDLLQVTDKLVSKNLIKAPHDMTATRQTLEV